MLNNRWRRLEPTIFDFTLKSNRRRQKTIGHTTKNVCLDKPGNDTPQQTFSLYIHSEKNVPPPHMVKKTSGFATPRTCVCVNAQWVGSFYLFKKKQYLMEKWWWYLYKVENRFELGGGRRKKQKKGEQLSILLLLLLSSL